MSNSLPALLAGFGAGGFLSLLSVVNPPSTVPMYLALAQKMEPRQRARMARQASIYCFGIMVASLFVGGLVLRAFGVSYGALRVAGGLVVLILGFDLMYDKGPTRPIDRQSHPPANPTFFPLAMPGITGPGTIAVVIGISTEMRDLGSLTSLVVAHVFTVAAMAGVCFVEWVLLRSAPRVSNRLGPIGIEVMTRLSGFILICVGVQFIASGVRTLIVGGA